MEEEYKKTYKYLKGYIKTKGKTAFSELKVKEYEEMAKENNLISTVTIKYITGLNWREFKNKLLREE